MDTENQYPGYSTSELREFLRRPTSYVTETVAINLTREIERRDACMADAMVSRSALMRFCSDCNHESEATAWNVQMRVRLCPKCQQDRDGEAAAYWTYQDENGEIVR